MKLLNVILKLFFTAIIEADAQMPEMFNPCTFNNVISAEEGRFSQTFLSVSEKSRAFVPAQAVSSLLWGPCSKES